jgi:hypothetical protein
VRASIRRASYRALCRASYKALYRASYRALYRASCRALYRALYTNSCRTLYRASCRASIRRALCRASCRASILGKKNLGTLLQAKIGVCKTCVSRNFGSLRRFAVICYEHIDRAGACIGSLCVCSKLLQIAANYQNCDLRRFCRPQFSFATTRLKKNFLMLGLFVILYISALLLNPTILPSSRYPYCSYYTLI